MKAPLALAALLCALPAFAQDDTAIRISPERPTPLEPVHVSLTVGYWGDPDLEFAGVEGNKIFFHWDPGTYPGFTPPYELWTAEATVGPLSPGLYSVELYGDGSVLTRTFEVVAPQPELLLRDTGDTYFTVTVQLDSPPLDGPGYGVPLTDESGYFWFFDPDNVELTVKILDGRPVNGKYWLFLASMTDLDFTVQVQQCPDHGEPAPCTAKVYRSVPGQNRNIIDLEFPGL